MSVNAVSIIIALGALTELFSVFARGFDETRRGLFCWTISALAFVLSAVVYFSQARWFSADIPQLAGGLGAAAVCLVTALAAEFFAPSKRLRRKERPAVDVLSAERSFNYVAAVICAVLALSGAAASLAECAPAFIMSAVIASALSLRQLSYYLGTAGTGTQSERERIQKLKKRIGTDDRTL